MPVFHRKNIEGNDEHYTSAWVFQRLDLTFDIDVCAPKGGIDWIPALKHYSLEDDSLVQPWVGRVWMNPPYSSPTPWVDKFIDHGNGIALLPVTRGKWFNRIWEAADAVVPDVYNAKFEKPDGTKKVITFRTMFFAIGLDNAIALDRLDIGRVRNNNK